MLDTDPRRYTRLWARAAANAMPIIAVSMQNIRTRVSRKILALVDTGADVSTLTATAADDLGIDRAIRSEDVAAVIRDAGGAPMIGLRRWVQVYLDDTAFTIPVIVPPRLSPDDAGDSRKLPLAALPQFNVLGRARVLERFILCFDTRRLCTWPGGPSAQA